MVIDPGDQIDGILEILRQEKLTLKQIVITHAHIDHVGGAMKLKAATGASILMNQNDYALLKMLDIQAAWVGMRPPGEVKVDEAIGQGRVLKIGEISSNVIHTPGHTEGSICVYFPAEKKLIAGDTLFAGGIGRTDLPGGSMEKIMRSLHHQVLALPDETEVVPGHGPRTTIGEERETNPFLQK
jgi:glyoxylase-like metal-dependent hydrolase (beta-lactamase superfamily II)